jgi:hypothetical protein
MKYGKELSSGERRQLSVGRTIFKNSVCRIWMNRSHHDPLTKNLVVERGTPLEMLNHQSLHRRLFELQNRKLDYA